MKEFQMGIYMKFQEIEKVIQNIKSKKKKGLEI